MSTTIPIATITSVYASAASEITGVLASLSTETGRATVISLQMQAQNLEATMSYYSLLGDLATQTNSESAQAIQTQVLEASQVIQQLFSSQAFYQGRFPSVPGNGIMACLYGIFLLLHFLFGFLTRQWWFMTCFTLGLTSEVIGYIGRIESHYHMLSLNPFVIQLVCITIAPCFLLAGVYYLLAQLTVVMGDKFSKLKPMHYSMIFIVCDLIAIIIQAVGGAIAATASSVYESTRPGANIMVVGLAFQVAAMSLFQYFWYDFLYHCYREYKLNHGSGFNPDYQHVRDGKYFIHFLVVICVAVLLVFIRSIYRLIELIEGFTGTLASVEIYFMLLEALMIVVAVTLLTIAYPGFVYGLKTDIVVKKGISFHPKEKPKQPDLEKAVASEKLRVESDSNYSGRTVFDELTDDNKASSNTRTPPRIFL
ncbi:unnamed protein product [Ambrosiozyma monospora]|uniref:Sphingoid long-chain base transporter RSB1 n=1 Tax=Ambrosiozyma monospora TaxID=43982 RepID=A0A9W6YW71_AMBMO|nr:unnamed protein product [Ambrosiozyma monospora]